MKKREPVSISFCERCGSNVSSRVEVCSNCGSLPYQDDRKFENENDVPKGVHPNDWSDELFKKYSDWLDNYNEVNFCKDCGMSIEEVQKFDFNEVVDENTGEVTSENNHPCNPNSPIFE